MGLLSKLFGASEVKEKITEAVEYKGYSIYPEARKEGSQYRIAGRICKEIDGEIKTHDFIRSDVLTSEEQANEIMLQKARLFIDQMSDSIF